MENANQTNILKLIASILDIDQNLTGIDYLKEFIKNIAQELDIKYVLIGHPTDEELHQVQTDVVWANGAFSDNFMYQLKDTPCELVLTGERVCIHQKDVVKDFPEDKLLQDMQIESYIGAPVVSKGLAGVSSILVLLDTKPMEDRDFFTSMADFLSLRASAEIEKHRIEENLQLQVEERTHQLAKAKEEIEEAKDEIEIINKNLEKRVQEEILENEKKQQIIFQQSKMASMGEMIENIAHQWRQPLSVISTTATGLQFKNELKMLEEDEIDESLNYITQSVKHLSQTINDFREFFNTNKIKKNFLIQYTFENTFKLLSSQLCSKEITIVKNIEDIGLNGFENELIQVFLNIINNAIDELIKQNHSQKLILIDVFKQNDKLEIHIKDNAGGIPKEILPNIFEAHFTTKKDSDGTGIGLYMSKMIITELMNADIKAQNSEFIFDKQTYIGAEFIITLPLSIEQ